MGKKVLIWGASDNCITRYVRSLNLDVVDILAFVDSDMNRSGTYVKKGDKFSKVRSEYLYWPVESVKVILPEQIIEEKYDYLLIGSLEYANEIYESILQRKDLTIDNKKILLVPDNLYNGVFFEIDKYGNNQENSNIFKNGYYELILRYNDIIRQGIDCQNNVVMLKGLKYPLDVFMHDIKSTWHEMNDILQDYVFDEEKSFSFVEGPYEYGNVVIEEDDVVFDCGANIGLFTGLGSLKAKNGTIYAFEPIPEILSMLQKTAVFYNNVITCELALSNEVGSVNMQYDRNHMMGSSIVNNGQGNIEVELDTIDHFVETNQINRVDFIKADIEGAERYLLEGAKETLKKHAPKISICTYHLEDDKEVLERLIKEANPEYIVEHKWLKLYAYVPKK